jgi:hypothetical protein
LQAKRKPVPTTEERKLEAPMKVADELYQSVKASADRISGLVISSFQIWTHLRNVPKVRAKDEYIKQWEAQIEAKPQVIRELPMSAHKESMASASSVRKVSE